ncbi:c-type cytochrome [uncultured Aquincola sp.]|uniref:c-type cytochrome n=1 Tax=uncultured Aquincola sp. TaxID=886556 RepID=UPI0032B1AF27
MDTPALQNLLLQGAQAAQRGLLALLHALGLAPAVHGQPAWPLPWRVAVENLLIDGGLARDLALWLLLAAIALGFVLLGLAWRRRRWPLLAGAAALLALAPWPPAALLFTPAVPTSFHRSPTGFEAAGIQRGLALYQAHCAACHGADGRGEGPLAASLPRWPPTLSAGLLWKRAEGELLWRVQQGLYDAQGRPTMPGFADRLSTDDTWAVLDAMKLLAAGDSARRQAAWPWPVAAPDMAVACADAPGPRPLSHWRGQRVRLVLVGRPLPQPIEDPRFVTVVLGAEAAQDGGVAMAREAGADCSVRSDAAYAAYAQLAGAVAPDRVSPGPTAAGLQWLIDRDGWLRAVSRPGAPGWSADDLLCRADPGASDAKAQPRDGLDALIARMDAEPVQVARLGLPHAR